MTQFMASGSSLPCHAWGLYLERITAASPSPSSKGTLLVVNRGEIAIRICRAAAHLGIKKLSATETGGKIEFDQETTVDPTSIVELVQSEPHRYRLGTANQLIVDEKMEKPEARFSKIERLLERLENKQVSIVS